MPNERVEIARGEAPNAESGAAKGWVLQKGEASLASGTFCFVFAIALTHFVMGFFLAFVPAIFAMLFLVAGAARARNSPASAGAQSAGGLLLLIALCIITVIGFRACALSYQEALHAIRPSAPPPGIENWAIAVLTWFIPVIFVAPGLKWWTCWSRRRRCFWCVVAFLVPAGIVIVHQVLAANGGPLSA